MEQLKLVTRGIVKYRFWILCGVVVLLSVGSWHVSASGLRDQFKKQESDIDSKYKAASTLKSKKDSPNDFSNTEMDKLNAQTLQHVVQAWERQYDRQLDLLKWDDELREDFIAAVRPLKPIELKIDPPPTPLTQELKVDFRQRYANYVGRLLPKLATRIGTKWLAKRSDISGSGGGYDPGSMMPSTTMMPMMPAAGAAGTDPRAKPAAEKPPLVLWNPGDQSRLLGLHFDWSKQPDAAPTTLQVLYAQEDLWILHTLMEVIRKANGDIESRHEATVKTIESIMIGRTAPPRAGQVVRLGGFGEGGYGGGYGSGGMQPPMDFAAGGSATSAPGGSATAAPGGSATAAPGGSATAAPGGSATSGPGPGMPGMPSVYGEAGAMAASTDPAQGRYVDTNYKPVEAKQLRDALKANPPDPKNAFLVVAKRMPLRMRLVVDQRKLHRFLAECGNSPLPIEIRQVRINRQAGATGGYEGGAAPGYMPDMSGGGVAEMPASESGGGFMGGSMGGMPYGPGAGGGFLPGGELKGRSVSSSNPAYDIPVELYGIIYIYNPVAKEKLGVEPAASAPAPAVPAA
jgi:hypothetical protein